MIIKIGNWLFNAIRERKEPKYSNSLGDAVRDGISLPENPTNGDIIRALFPNAIIHIFECLNSVNVITDETLNAQTFDLDWWNAPWHELIDAAEINL